MTYTDVEFKECVPADTYLSCPHRDIREKSRETLSGTSWPRCLFGLYKQDDNMVRRHCSLVPLAHSSQAVAVSNTEFALFTDESDRVKVHCPGHHPWAKSLQPGVIIIALPVGCRAETNSVILTPEESVAFEAEVPSELIEMDVFKTGLDNLTEETLLRMATHQSPLSKVAANRAALDWVAAHKDALGKTTFQSSHGLANTVTTYGSTIVMVVVVVWLVRRCCGHSTAGSNTPAVTVSAPPAPTTVIQPAPPAVVYNSEKQEVTYPRQEIAYPRVR